MARTVSNNGIGALYGTFTIDVTGEDYDLDSDDVGKAVALSGNNEVDFGADGGRLLGRLEHVQDGVATVQVAGVVRLPVTDTVPSVGDSVVVNGSGSVKKTGVSEEGRGVVISVDSENSKCDVLL